jgi:beta-lactamase class D
MSLRDAIKISNIPIYQELARRIGLENMQKSVAGLHYGNAEIGSAVDVFWLKGPLEISPIEQTRFLANLAGKKLPFPLEAQEAVRGIIMIEQGDGWALFAKTGTVAEQSPQIGWWVGWVEKGGRIYSFAINLSLRKPEDAGKRVELGRACLEALDIL